MRADRAELIQDPPLTGKAHFLSRRQKRKHTKAAASADRDKH